ncbi:MAG: DUF2110 family protein [Promethearchaeota archaeon]
MTKNLVLLDKLDFKSPRDKKQYSFKYYRYLSEFTEGFPATKIFIKKIRNFDKRMEVRIKGPEEIFIYNLLKKEIGSIHNFDDVKVGDIYKGNMVNVGKVGFGIFVDCGVLNPPTDVLLELRTLRKQLCDGKKFSVKKIIKAYDFIDNFPLYVEITDKDEEKKQLYGKIADKTLNLINRILDENIDALLIIGTTKNQFKKAIERKGHFKDVISVKRIGFLEHVALLKEGTNGAGIIASIGKLLPKTKMCLLKPNRIKEIIEL